jgi:sulfatase modifying factor 1
MFSAGICEVIGAHVKPSILCAATGIVFVSMAFRNGARGDVFNLPAGQTNLQFVTVGDAGNAPDTRIAGISWGAVPYVYQVGKYEVTVAQYADFLNAVATHGDPYGLYTSPNKLAPTYDGIPWITAHSGVFMAVAGFENMPIGSISWESAARFANWLTNGEPRTGVEDATTTENGSYALNGATTDAALSTITRSASARYVIPTADEWYKAAYYKGGSTNAGYWTYATQSDTAPSSVLSATGTNNANYFDTRTLKSTDSVKHFTPVGSFAASPSAYGTFDQDGNAYEWDETLMPSPEPDYDFANGRGIIGGSNSSAAETVAPFVDSYEPTIGPPFVGFRIALVPEPQTLGMLMAGSALVFYRGVSSIRRRARWPS